MTAKTKYVIGYFDENQQLYTIGYDVPEDDIPVVAGLGTYSVEQGDTEKTVSDTTEGNSLERFKILTDMATRHSLPQHIEQALERSSVVPLPQAA